MEKEFERQVRQDIAQQDTDDYEIITTEIVDTTRWSTVHEMVFQDLATGKCYRSYFNRGATEMQDECPYEFDKKIIKCVEVVEKEVTSKQWVNKED